MTPDIALGLALGVGIGLANAAASYGLYRLVRGRSDQAFYSVVLMGLLGRLGLALMLVAAIVVAVPVHLVAFVSALLASVAAGLAVETALIYRSQRRTARGPSSFPQTSL